MINNLRLVLSEYADRFRMLRLPKRGRNIWRSESDDLAATTHVELTFHDKDGNLINVVDLGSNIITDLGRANMAHLLAGDDVSNRAVTKLQFGDGGHTPGNPTVAITPSPADTALYGDMIIEKTVSYSFPEGVASTKIRFSASVSVDEGNGSGAQAYSEVGLFDAQGRMLTHKTFGLITKSDAFSITINYTIMF